MISDTHPEIAKRMQEMFRRMGPERRVQMAIQMSDDVRALALAGIRMRKPGLSREDENRELMRVMYGLEAAR
jgi:hypothetical protein